MRQRALDAGVFVIFPILLLGLASRAADDGSAVVENQDVARVAPVCRSAPTDVGDDFASTLGTGGVLGTKFTWPDYGPGYKNVYLNPAKEAHWKKWIALYNEKMLSKGTFLDLYVYGYDVPEAYAIEKGGAIYYAFYAPVAAGKNSKEGAWSGEAELRGLGNRTYRVTDYVNGKDYGSVTGPTAKLRVDFIGSLLLEVK